ncbi:hypothetical protein LTR36_000258 [Oleoguttula mirabilis]|uniref:Uncharacterized protein n=1 Tax=Oleoguttula mirabilis TaxID=1507867 RepID=A0AAV9K194_9PEZI|nr:hypothetical protein LTR36_000258 [Oleoguttula mirabilis]
MAQRSPLLNLPREVRNLIYEDDILDEQPMHLKANLTADSPRRASFTTISPIILVCRQIHDEYLDSLEAVLFSPNRPHAKIDVPVTDFNFDNLILFVKKLSAGNIRALTAHSKLEVTLTVTRPWKAFLFVEAGLQPWLACCKETSIGAQYDVDEGKCGSGMLDELPSGAAMSTRFMHKEESMIVVALMTWEIRASMEAAVRRLDAVQEDVIQIAGGFMSSAEWAASS